VLVEDSPTVPNPQNRLSSKSRAPGHPPHFANDTQYPFRFGIPTFFDSPFKEPQRSGLTVESQFDPTTHQEGRIVLREIARAKHGRQFAKVTPQLRAPLPPQRGSSWFLKVE